MREYSQASKKLAWTLQYNKVKNMKTTLFTVAVKGLNHPLQMRATSLADAKVSARLLFGRDAKVVTV